MWYTRGVFNNYLARMGVSESSCTEKQAMLALGATSDELRKYPMVTNNLQRHAGPQCYAHLDPRSADYRVDILERREKAHGRTDAAGLEDDEAGVFNARCWLSCAKCKKLSLIHI